MDPSSCPTESEPSLSEPVAQTTWRVQCPHSSNTQPVIWRDPLAHHLAQFQDGGTLMWPIIQDGDAHAWPVLYGGAPMWLILHFTQNGSTPTWIAVQSPTYMQARLTEPRSLLPPQTRVQVPLVPPGLTKTVNEQTRATWKQHTKPLSTTPFFQNSVQNQVFNQTISLLCSVPCFISFSPFWAWLGGQRPQEECREILRKFWSLREFWNSQKTLPHLRGLVCHGQLLSLCSRQKQIRLGGLNDIKDPPFFSGGSSPVLGLICLPPEGRRLSMPETGEKERNYYLFEIIQTKVL